MSKSSALRIGPESMCHDLRPTGALIHEARRNPEAVFTRLARYNTDEMDTLAEALLLAIYPE